MTRASDSPATTGETRVPAQRTGTDPAPAATEPATPAASTADTPAGPAADPAVFERLFADARRALRFGEPALAIQRLDEALRLWPDPAPEAEPAPLGEAAGAWPGRLRLAAIALRGQALAAVASTRVVPATVPAALDIAEPACVGRDEELAWLIAAFDLAATRRAQGRLIVGGPGLGKTRLVAEVARYAAARGVATRYGRAGVTGLDSMRTDRLSLVILDDLDQATHEDVLAATDAFQAARDDPVVLLVTCRDPVRVGELQVLPKLVLSPLDEPAIVSIVQSYAPAASPRAAIRAVADAVGVPARVHRIACEWAFGRAGRRVDRAVALAEPPRAQLATVERDVAAGVLDLILIRERAEALRGAPRSAHPRPYPGLSRYEATDADVFCGRERLVAELVARLVRAPFLAVVGPAGSGKSSLVRAGLLPALASAALPGSGSWQPVVITPTTVTSLPALLATLNPSAPVLLVVDQLDELFSALTSEARDEFAAALVAFAETGRVVVTLRHENLPRCGCHPTADPAQLAPPDLARLVSANLVLMAPMTGEERRRAVLRPARLAGLELEDGLLDRIVADAACCPDDLSGLAAALYGTWTRRSGARLTLAGYNASGGVAGAAAVLAEQAFAGLAPSEREPARSILMRLSRAPAADPDPATADFAPAEATGAGSVDLAEVVSLAGPRGSAALEHLIKLGLVRVTETVAPAPAGDGSPEPEPPASEPPASEPPASEPSPSEPSPSEPASKQPCDRVELVHGLLAQRWPRLRDWLGDAASERTLRRHLARDSAAWLERARPADALYRGARLAVALEAASRRRLRLTPAEREFLRAGEQAALEADNRRKRHVARMWRWLIACLVVAVLAIAVATVAVIGQLRTLAAAQRRDAATVAAWAYAEPDLPLALLLAVAAYDLDGSQATALADVLARGPDLLAASQPVGVTVIAVSPDGQRVAAGTGAGKILLLRPDSLAVEQALELDGHAPINGLAFAGRHRLVSWAGGPSSPGQATIVVWDLNRGGPEGNAFGQSFPGSGGGLAADGDTLLLAHHSPAKTTLVAWSVGARTPSTAYELPSGPIESVVVSPDGRVLALGGPVGSTIIDLTTGARQELASARRPLALSPDATTLLTHAVDTVAVWDVRAGGRRGEVTAGRAAVVAAWSSDGTAFATPDPDGGLTIWDAETLAPARVLAGNGHAAATLAFAPDGRTLYSASSGGPVLAWDLTGTRGAGAALLPGTDGETLAQAACAAAGRDLTGAEWSRVLPGRGFASVCPRES